MWHLCFDFKSTSLSMQRFKTWYNTVEVQLSEQHKQSTEVCVSQRWQCHCQRAWASLYFITHWVWRTVSQSVLLEFSLYHITSHISLLQPHRLSPPLLTCHPLTSQPNTLHPFFGGGKWNNFVVGSPGGFVISCLCMIILCCPASRNSGLPNADRW